MIQTSYSILIHFKGEIVVTKLLDQRTKKLLDIKTYWRINMLFLFILGR